METLEEADKIDLTKLCYWDKRNPDFSIKEENGYDKEEIEACGNFSKKDCYCDNCFYGRSKLTEQLINQVEKMITKEAYEDSLNMQRCSNAGYESKIQELTQELEKMYSEKEVYNLLKLARYSNFHSLTTEEWFEHFKKK